MTSFNKILVGMDFSGPSKEAARRALELGKRLDAEVEFCHVIDDRYTSMTALFVAQRPSFDEEELVTTARSKLSDFLEDLPLDGVRVEQTVLSGVPTDELLDHVVRTGADMVVVGSHGRRGVQRALLGSDAEDVTRRCPVPVLVVHDPPAA